MSEYDDNTNYQEDYVHIHLSGVAFHVRCVGLGCHVVIGVGRLVVRFHHAYVIQIFFLMLVSSSIPTVAIIVACCTSRNGSFEVLSLHTPSVTVDRRQL